MRYHDSITLDPDVFGPTMIDGVEEFLRGVAHVSRVGNEIEFEIDTEGDLWDLRERVEEIEIELQSRGVTFIADRSKIVGREARARS